MQPHRAALGAVFTALMVAGGTGSATSWAATPPPAADIAMVVVSIDAVYSDDRGTAPVMITDQDLTVDLLTMFAEPVASWIPVPIGSLTLRLKPVKGGAAFVLGPQATLVTTGPCTSDRVLLRLIEGAPQYVQQTDGVRVPLLSPNPELTVDLRCG